MPAMSTTPPSVLPHYVDLAHRCRERVVDQFMKRFHEFIKELPDILLQLADRAENGVLQAHCMDVRHEVSEHGEEMAQRFYHELMGGFERFILGQEEPAPDDILQPTTNQQHLSLVEKETFEIDLAFDTVANSAHVNYNEQIYALTHRLAVINGGFKPGERRAMLPGSPRHVCNAYRAALSVIQIPMDIAVKISLIEAFEKHVLRQAGSIYQEYNQLLRKAGILPNIEEFPVYSSSGSQKTPGLRPVTEAGQASSDGEQPAPQPSQTTREALTSTTDASQHGNRGPSTQEEIFEQEIFQNISNLLQQRRTGNTDTAPKGTESMPDKGTGSVTELIAALDRRDAGSQPVKVPQDIATQPLEQIRAEFSAQLAQLAELIKKHHISHTDADVIELVGLLFELILNDPNLPDSIKALLSHLHTPYLKVALLDRKFFFKRRHPARLLLNALAQAGTKCNATEKNEQTIFTRIRETVNRVITEFDDNVDLFDTLLTEFEEFLRKFHQRARMLEKRVIEKARGQEKLREARQAVAHELVQIAHGKSLPETAEKLLFGPWSNLLVLLYIRKGANSEIRKHYLRITEEIIWSVQPKNSPEEENELQQRLPEIRKSIQEGLTLLGYSESSTESLLNELDRCYRAASDPGGELLEPEDFPDLGRYPLFQEIDPEEFSGEHTSGTTQVELQPIIQRLQKIRLGTWFEFQDDKGGQAIRAKLSWFSPRTSYYIFINQSGIQVAVKPLKKLAREILDGRAKILELDKKPFVERAIKRIHGLLNSKSLN